MNDRPDADTPVSGFLSPPPFFPRRFHRTPIHTILDEQLVIFVNTWSYNKRLVLRTTVLRMLFLILEACYTTEGLVLESYNNFMISPNVLEICREIQRVLSF